MKQHRDFEGKVAIVTGGSRGLGREIAIRLGSVGVSVCINYLSSHWEADEVTKQIRAIGGRCVAMPADVRSREQVEKLVSDVQSQLGPIDILVHCAFAPERPSHVFMQDWQDYLEQLEYALKAPLLLVKLIAPGMQAKNWGRIICLGSEIGRLGNAHCAAYASAKAALSGAVRSWARDLGKNEITVNVVAPGWVPVERHSDVPEHFLEAYRNSVPLARLGTPADVASLVLFLASGDSGFVTGQTIAVDGGNTMV